MIPLTPGSTLFPYTTLFRSVLQGTLVNAADGTIRSLNATYGLGGGNRFLNAALDNRGLVDLSQYGLNQWNSSELGSDNVLTPVTVRARMLYHTGTNPSFTNS